MAKQKKIIITVTNDLSFDQRMQRICSSLSDHNFNVQIVGRKKSHSIPLQKQAYTQTRIYCFFEKGKLFYLEYNLKLFFFLLFKRADIVSAVDLDTLLPVFLVSKFKSIPCVYDAHEYFTEVPEVTRRPFVQKIWLKLEAWILPQLKYAYTVCDSIAELFKDKYGTTFVVVRNAPILEEFSEHMLGPIEENSIIYQGALNEGRGLEKLFYAIQDMEVTLYLAGDGDIKAKLKELSRSLGIQKKVNFLGFVRPHELKILTRKMYIGIGVSENLGLSYFYSLNNKFFDYIHAQIPSIGNNWPEYQKINKQIPVALLCNSDVEELKESIHKLLFDKEFYNELKRNCSIARKILNWEMEEKKLIQLYKSVH